ncbi:MAG: zinc ABC transporter substrate-binding protein [Rubricoccaceae bacterium]|nr:zinc ABC transporter substrate-binding protein [Rubricoccaceae bacterium]
MKRDLLNRDLRPQAVGGVLKCIAVGRRLPVLPAIFFLVATIVAGCASGPERTDVSTRTVQVVATTSMIADLAREIGGDRVNVAGLMGPGVDPHLYRATEGDVTRMTGADIIFFNGLHLEGKMAEVLEQVERQGIVAEAVAEVIPDSVLLAPPEYEGNFDPHVWMDVSLWKQVAGAVAGALADLDTTHAVGYRERLADYSVRLDSLDAWVRQRLSDVNENQRVLVTAHDAFNYFGLAYDFEVKGLQGISTATEAGTADVQDLAAFVANRRIPAMFVESSVPPRSIEAVQAAVRSRGFDVRIGGNLYSDALGSPESGHDNYESMIRHNINTIADALTPQSVTESPTMGVTAD